MLELKEEKRIIGLLGCCCVIAAAEPTCTSKQASKPKATTIIKQMIQFCIFWEHNKTNLMNKASS